MQSIRKSRHLRKGDQRLSGHLLQWNIHLTSCRSLSDVLTAPRVLTPVFHLPAMFSERLAIPKRTIPICPMLPCGQYRWSIRRRKTPNYFYCSSSLSTQTGTQLSHFPNILGAHEMLNWTLILILPFCKKDTACNGWTTLQNSNHALQ